MLYHEILRRFIKVEQPLDNPTDYKEWQEIDAVIAKNSNEELTDSPNSVSIIKSYSVVIFDRTIFGTDEENCTATGINVQNKRYTHLSLLCSMYKSENETDIETTKELLEKFQNMEQ